VVVQVCVCMCVNVCAFVWVCVGLQHTTLSKFLTLQRNEARTRFHLHAYGVADMHKRFTIQSESLHFGEFFRLLLLLMLLLWFAYGGVFVVVVVVGVVFGFRALQ
jgi:hypothetical protein